MKRVKSHWVWLLPLFAFVPVLMAPSGGYPSFPIFQSLFTNGSQTCSPSPQVAGECINAGASAVGITVLQTSANGSGGINFYDTTNSAGRGGIGSGANCAGQSVNDLCFTSGTSGKIVKGTSNGGAVIGEMSATIACTTACSGANLHVGDSLIINKGTATNRASTTTQTADPDLTVTGLPGGSFSISGGLSWTNGGGSYKFQIQTSACGIPGGIFNGIDAQASPVVVNLGAGSLVGGALAAGTSQFFGSFNGSGTIAVCWAQNSSNVTNTTLNSQTSYLIVTRLL